VLAVDAARKSTRRKSQSLIVDEKVEKARVDAERRSGARAEGLAAEATRLSRRRKTNPLTTDKKAEKAIV